MPPYGVYELNSTDKKVLKNNYTVYSDQDNGNTVLLDMYSKDFVTIDKFLFLLYCLFSGFFL